MKQPAFIFDDVNISPEQQIGWHSHPQWELSFVICGHGTRTIGNRTETISEGEVILVPPDIPHVWQFSHSETDSRISNISVFFEGTVIDGLRAVFPEASHIADRLGSLTDALAYDGETRAMICRLLYSMRGLTPEARLPKMISLLFLIADTDACSTVGNNSRLSRCERRMETIRVFCACNYARNIQLADIASHVGMNKSSFCTFMRKHAGQTFSQYMNSLRLKHAAERIRHTDDNIATIAYDTGFANVTYFNRLFKSAYGCTPQAMRRSRR